MCSKLIAFLLIVAICIGVLILESAMRKDRNMKEIPPCIPAQLVVVPSVSDLENRLHYSSEKYSKSDISAGSAHFIFYASQPYSGFLIDGVYCYEEVENRSLKSHYWILRGYFPVNASIFQEYAKHHPKTEQHFHGLEYFTNGSSVGVRQFGVELFSIKSVAEASKTVEGGSP